METFITDGRSAAKGLLVNEDFSIGPYAVRNVRRGAEYGGETTFGAYSKQNSESGYRYQFVKNDTLLFDGRCELLSNSSKIKLRLDTSITLTNQHILSCWCGAAAEQPALSADIAWSDIDAIGNVSHLQDEYLIHSEFAQNSGHISATQVGYKLEGPNSSTVVAAAETVMPGKIWLREGLTEEQKEAFSCLFSGLMLFSPPDVD